MGSRALAGLAPLLTPSGYFRELSGTFWRRVALQYTGVELNRAEKLPLPSLDTIWIVFLAVLVTAQIAVSLFLPRGSGLTIASDLIQSMLFVVATSAYLRNTVRSRCSSRRTQLFWILMSACMVLWLTYQGMWSYFEVFLREEVPEPFFGDIIVFLHLVPMMAALALHPHQRHKQEDFHVGMFDFSLLLTWWVFLYIYTVIPWQYVQVSEAVYSYNFNQLYLTEKLVPLTVLLFAFYTAQGGWRRLYAQMLGAVALYATSSYLANRAIGHHTYYTGSIYDVPLTLSVAWIATVGRFARRYDLSESGDASRSVLRILMTRLAMLALLSLPWFALHAQLTFSTPPAVRNFRTILSLATLIVMGILVFWRQSLLGSELARLLETSRRSLRDLKALQEQLIQSEKLASLGRLVGGAAHEINNPLTAMLGYSELLGASDLPLKEQGLAKNIGEQVRLTKTLVASLLTFARQSPAVMSAVDLNSVVKTTMRLLAAQFEAAGLETRMELGPGLPPVRVDANQLLHVCIHLATHTGNSLLQAGTPMCVRTREEDGMVLLEVSDMAPAATESYTPLDINEGSDSPKTLSLRACCGIVKEHGGRISVRRFADGRVAHLLQLPATSKSAVRLAQSELTPATRTPSSSPR